MKGGGVSSSYSLPAKRRWKGLVIAVLGLVLLSMLVPLVFLLGLHTGFHSITGSGTERQNTASTPIKIFDQQDPRTRNQSKGIGNSSVDKTRNRSKGIPVLADLPKVVTPKSSWSKDKIDGKTTIVDESEVTCELKFGTYCLWHREHREKMEDSFVKKMKDLLFVARAYYPSIAKLPKFKKLTREMKQNIQDFERVLSEATTDRDLPSSKKKRATMMEAVIAKAKSCPVDCNNVYKKFRQLVDLTQDEARFHMKQSAFLYKLAVQTMPKSLHCLSMRLTVEYFRSPYDIEDAVAKKYLNPELYHYVIFSTNILASSVAINSTVVHAKQSKKQVFHVITDRENYYSMNFWFSRSKYGDAVVQVLKIEDPELYSHVKEAPMHLSLPEEFRFTFRRIDKQSSSIKYRTEYLSMISHSLYLLPEIFQPLNKVVVLDDDVVVQRDLSGLWNLNMGGKVNGALQSCTVKLSHMKTLLSSKNYDENSCAWTSGVNIIDLSKWRTLNLTMKYQRLVQELNNGEELPETTTLRASLLTFHDQVYPLEDSWMVSGLGYDYGVDTEALNTAAVLHFDGLMKPWLDLGIPKYKKLWKKYVNTENHFLSDCNVNQ